MGSNYTLTLLAFLGCSTREIHTIMEQLVTQLHTKVDKDIVQKDNTCSNTQIKRISNLFDFCIRVRL